MARVDQDDMTEARVVAIWLGDHRDELDLDEYMTDQFEDDFGFTINERQMPEIDTQPELVPVGELLKGFSMWESWYDSAVSRCAENGIEQASSAVVFHFLRFAPERCQVVANPSLQFVGNFDWLENTPG